MAEIHVQAKKQNNNLTWVWILVALLVIAVIAYFVLAGNKNTDTQNTTVNPANTTSQVKPPQPKKPAVVVPTVYLRSV